MTPAQMSQRPTRMSTNKNAAITHLLYGHAEPLHTERAQCSLIKSSRTLLLIRKGEPKLPTTYRYTIAIPVSVSHRLFGHSFHPKAMGKSGD